MNKKIVYKGSYKRDFNFLIRYPAKKDLKEMYRYINELSNEKTFVRYQGDEVSLKEERNYLKEQLERINKNESVELLVLVNNKIVGVSSIDLKDGAQNHEGVLGISISEDFRNKGIGKILLDLIIKEAKENMPKLKIITLSIFGNNEVASNLYKSFGFKEYGRLPNGIKHKNKFVDNVLMNRNV